MGRERSIHEAHRNRVQGRLQTLPRRHDERAREESAASQRRPEHGHSPPAEPARGAEDPRPGHLEGRPGVVGWEGHDERRRERPSRFHGHEDYRRSSGRRGRTEEPRGEPPGDGARPYSRGWASATRISRFPASKPIKKPPCRGARRSSYIAKASAARAARSKANRRTSTTASTWRSSRS